MSRQPDPVASLGCVPDSANLPNAAVPAPGPDRIVHRDTARVLLVDGRGRVLLMHGWDPAKPDQPFWFTVGGAREPGEGLADAAARELFEETGIRVAPEDLGEPIAVHRHRFGWDGLTLMQKETYFAMAATAVEISFAGMEQIEVETIDRADWWTPEDLDIDGTAGFPELTDFMRQAVRSVGGR